MNDKKLSYLQERQQKLAIAESMLRPITIEEAERDPFLKNVTLRTSPQDYGYYSTIYINLMDGSKKFLSSKDYPPDNTKVTRRHYEYTYLDPVQPKVMVGRKEHKAIVTSLIIVERTLITKATDEINRIEYQSFLMVMKSINVNHARLVPIVFRYRHF